MYNRAAIILVFSLFMGMFLVFLVSAIESESKKMTVEANIVYIEPPPLELKFEIPDRIDFQDVNCGNESQPKKIDINNTGQVDIKVSVENMSNILFENMKYSISGTSFSKLSSLSTPVSKPASGSNVRNKTIYLKLVLTDLDCTKQENIGQKSVEITFWAMPD